MIESLEKTNPETTDRLWTYKGKTKLDFERGLIPGKI